MANSKSIETKITLCLDAPNTEAIQHRHRGDFECAITLAGAGEGMLPETERPHFLQKARALEERLPKTDDGENIANAYINWLKHGRLKSGGPKIEEATITELEVTYTIWRAIWKFQAVYGSTNADRTPQMISFENWAREHLVRSLNCELGLEGGEEPVRRASIGMLFGTAMLAACSGSATYHRRRPN
jgi:hypothetical protein